AEFSEIKEYLHAPVRTYSNGMQARLGFSVAMHVDADVLVVDEVLSVGDRNFERKCFSRIQEFREAGGTILLVSHQADTIRTFADRAAWLDEGKIRMIGDPEDVIRAYQAEV
ncbi:MAG: sugar ABC transporter ATP-binding protein, partial [Armatimonadota bacterium]